MSEELPTPVAIRFDDGLRIEVKSRMDMIGMPMLFRASKRGYEVVRTKDIGSLTWKHVFAFSRDAKRKLTRVGDARALG